MESKEIIKSIHEIYSRFRIPHHLQMHMLRAAAVGDLICNSWKGLKINREDIIATALLHDLGNITKMDFDSEFNIKLLGKDRDKADYWKQVQREVIDKYGNDDFKATLKMVEELKVNKRVKSLLEKFNFLNTISIFESDDFDLKISAYTDYVVGPYGIISLKERIEEIKERYKAHAVKLLNDPNTLCLLDTTFKIEKQVLENTNLSKKDINNKSIQKYLERY